MIAGTRDRGDGGSADRRIGEPLGFEPAASRSWVGDLYDPPAFVSKTLKKSSFVRVTLGGKEVCLRISGRLRDPAVRDLGVKASQILALEIIIEIRRRNNEG
jgi:hypothetical protein